MTSTVWPTSDDPAADLPGDGGDDAPRPGCVRRTDLHVLRDVAPRGGVVGFSAAHAVGPVGLDLSGHLGGTRGATAHLPDHGRRVVTTGALLVQLDPEQLARLADMIAARTGASSGVVGWLDTPGAATYLGIHPATLRRLAASGALPSAQDAPGGPRYFRPADLDAWRLAR